MLRTNKQTAEKRLKHWPEIPDNYFNRTLRIYTGKGIADFRKKRDLFGAETNGTYATWKKA